MDRIADYVAAYAPADRRVPMVRLNMISSLDGAVTVDGHAGGLGGPADQRMMILLRMLADVIIVGANTVRIEGYQGDLIDEPAKRWRVARGLPPHPRFEVASRRAGRPLSALLAQFAGAQVLCEGGPHIFGALAQLDAIDELCLTVGPLLAGPGAGRITAGAPHSPRRMRLIHALAIDGLLFLRYASTVTNET